MKDLMFWGMIVISSLVIGMSIYILIVQAYLNKAMIDKFNEQKRELRRAFGWEEYNWAENFGDFARKVDKLIEFKKEIEQLEVIRKAIEAQRLSNLIGKKEQVEWEIKKLEEK
ncbi:hypothetical protein DW666_06220 [Streptococcus parasanguinis]|uniref:hypothetical protein n=1 Tax=Streptococcus parasanguinis TaxID=1318 RepID=UPI000E4F449C|nr:hypothetical protein [Streptococcus parasanguinis]RHF68612.1 hypothetical protein DW666_06220 [Streptococcus parasanguinis]